MPEQRFSGKTAVVTGGASGIGLAIARQLISEGARVVIGDINEDSLAIAANEFTNNARPAVVDVRNEAQVKELVQTALDWTGELDLGFNCAGLSIFGELTELDEADWNTVMDICLKGTWLALKHEAGAMSRGHGGAIVNIASLNSHVPMYGGGAYACAKAGVEMLSRNAALELAPQRIRVNTVSPGLTDTPLIEGLLAVQGVEQAFMERIPLQRRGTPEDMAKAALFLASDDAGYISGSNLFVDGGWETTAYPNLRTFRDAFAAAADQA